MRLWSPFCEALNIVISRKRRREAWRTALYVNSIYLIMNSAASAVLGFVFWVVVARLYAPGEVGLGAALISAASGLAFASSLGLGAGLIRFLPSAGTNRSALMNSCFTLSGLTAIVAAAIFLAGLPLWSPALGLVRDNPISVAAFIAIVVAGTIYSLLSETFVALRRAQFVLIKNLLQGLLKVALVLAMASLFQVFGIFISWGLAVAVALGLGILLFLPWLQPGYRPLPSLQRRVSNEMVHFSFANYASTGLWNAPAWLLPIMVVNLLGGEANAYFYMSWAMAGLLFAIPLATSLSLFAEGSHQEEFLGRDVRRSLKLIIVLLLPTIAAMTVMGDKLLLVFGRNYSLEGAKLLWVLAPSALPLSLNVVYLGIARVRKRLKDIILIAAAVGLGTLVLSYLLIPYLGILAPGVGWLVSHSLVALAVLPQLARLLKTAPVPIANDEG